MKEIKDYCDLSNAERIKLGMVLAKAIIEDGMVDYRGSYSFGDGLEVHRLYDMEAFLALNDYLESEGISQDEWEDENDIELFKEDGEVGVIYTREVLNEVLMNEFDDYVGCVTNNVSFSKVELV